MKTLKQSLVQMGISPPFAVPSGFQTCPNSLIEIIRILNLPEPDFTGWQEQCVHSFEENKAQGLVFAHDDVWFLSSQDAVFRFSVEGPDLVQPIGVHRLAQKSRIDLVQEAGLDADDYIHIGGLGYLDEVVFVPIQNKGDASWLLLGIDEQLRLVGYSLIPHEKHDAFVAVNPWNRLLYMYGRPESTYLYAYDVSEYLSILPNQDQYGALLNISSREEKNILLSDEIQGVQGISFSKDGFIILAWWYCREKLFGGCIDFANYLKVYNALTGKFLFQQEYDFAGWLDEIEGLSVHPSGVLYVAVNDHEVIDTDDFEIHAFQFRA